LSILEGKLQISRENASTSSSPSTKKIFPPFNNMAAADQHKNLNSQSIWQINLHKCSEANSLLVDDALNEAKIPIVLITEPFCNKNKKVELGAVEESSHQHLHGIVPTLHLIFPLLHSRMDKVGQFRQFRQFLQLLLLLLNYF
jgi:hypothetical protein